MPAFAVALDVELAVAAEEREVEQVAPAFLANKKLPFGGEAAAPEAVVETVFDRAGAEEVVDFSGAEETLQS